MPALKGHLVQIADIVCRIQSLDSALKIETDASTQRFLVKQAEPHVTFDARLGDLSEFKTPGKLIFDSNGVWKLYDEDELFSLPPPLQGCGFRPL